MHRMTTLITIIAVVSLLMSVSCTKSGGNGAVIAQIPDQNSTVDFTTETRVDAVIGTWSAEIDPTNQSFTITLDESRQAAYHHPLSQSFPDVLQVVDYSFTPNFWADIKLKHPLPGSIYDGFDPRVIAVVPVQSPGTYLYYPYLAVYANNSIVQNPDGYAKLFDNLGGSIPGNANPFKAYFQDQPYRRWSSTGVTEETQRWQMDITGFGGPVRFKLVVDVSTNYPYPPQERFDNAPEPVKIDAVVGPGLSQNGGSANITVTVLDWQGQGGIGGVKVEAPDLFNGTVNLTYSTPGPNPDEYVYAGIIGNSLLAPEGEYKILVAAQDQNTNVYLYDEFPVSVAGDLPQHGNLTCRLDGSSPSSTIVLSGTINNVMAKFRFIADNVEAFSVTKITLNLTDGWRSISKVTLEYPRQDGTTGSVVAVPSTTTLTFDNMDMYILRNGSAVLTVKADFYEIGAGGIYGDRIAVILDMFEAVGHNSGSSVTGDEDIDANPMYLYKSAPTVVSSNPSGVGTIVPGTVINLYKFKVTADAAGEIGIKKLTYSIFIIDASTTNPSDADLGGFTFLRNDVDLTASAQITQVSTDGGATWLATPLTIETDDTNDLENNISYWVQVTFDNSPANGGEQLIGAGETVEYTLQATAGTGFTTADAFSTTLLYDTTLPAASAFYLSDEDTGTGVQQVVTLQKADGTQDNADVEFVWSDLSSFSHSSTFDDDGVIETSSPDWTNGYLVKNFPLSTYGYTL